MPSRDHVGEDGGVGGGFEGFLGDLAGDLVLAVAVGDVADEDGGDDERAVEADGADGVVEDALVAPLRKDSSLVLEKPKSTSVPKIWETPM